MILDGVPPTSSGWGTPIWTWDGVPPSPDLEQGTPHKCGHTENIIFPHPLHAGAKNMEI